MLGDPQVDLVSILTFGSTHLEIGLAAIAAGKAVVCEKTLSDSAASSAQLVHAARQAGAFFATAYMKRFFPAAQKAKELLAEMGDIISIHARTWQPFGGLFGPDPPTDLTGRPSVVTRRYGGGVLVCGGSHILDLIHWFGGRAERVSGHLRFRPELDFDFQANALLWLPKGAMCHLECCWHDLKLGGYERNGWDERLEINTPQPSVVDGYVVDETIAAITRSSVERRTVELQWADR